MHYTDTMRNSLTDALAKEHLPRTTTQLSLNNKKV